MLEPQDHLAILALYAAYNWSADAGDAAGWARTFTDAGVFRHPARLYSGPAELRSFIDDRNEKAAAAPLDRQRHWNDGIELTGSGDEVSGGCRLLLSGVEKVGGKTVVVAQGRYIDRIVREDGAWRFAERALAAE